MRGDRWSWFRTRARTAARRSRRAMRFEGLERRDVPAITVPPGFTASILSLDALRLPTSMVVAPDGGIFVSGQWGDIRVIRDNQLLAAPAIQLDVSIEGERGLCGITLDPDFESNGYLYAYYTTKSAPVHNRVSRFQVDGDSVIPGSEQVLLDIPPVTANDFAVHNGGALHFGPDGKLYVGVGDHRVADAAQSLDSLYGKLLRINADGSIPTDNPFYGQATDKRRAIYALGLRNPYTFAFQPGTGRLFVNDVGEAQWEEVNEIVAGGNYGWPIAIGPEASAYRAPLYSYPHTSVPGYSAWELGCAVIGGVFTPAVGAFPAEYRESYFLSDFCTGAIRQLDPITGRVTQFATGLPDLAVDIDLTPDGRMLYLARRGESSGQVGMLIQIEYAVDAPPSIVTGPASQTVLVGTSATLSVSAGGSLPFEIEWLKNGEVIPGAVGTTYTTPPLGPEYDGVGYQVRIRNAFGEDLSAPATIHVSSNHAPVARILTPRRNLPWRPGQRIAFSGRAIDPEDGELRKRSFTWWVELHHDSHFHPFKAERTGKKAGAFRIPAGRHDTGQIWYRVYLRVNDSSGTSTTVFRDLKIRRFGPMS